jgi:hypothetical protein
MAAPKTGSAAAGIVLVPSGDGFYHKYNKATGKDEKTDVKIPPRGTTVDPELLKALTGADEIGGTPAASSSAPAPTPGASGEARSSRPGPRPETEPIAKFGGKGKLTSEKDAEGHPIYEFPDGTRRPLLR